MIKEIESIEEKVDHKKMFLRGGNGKCYGFNNFETLEKLVEDIRDKSMTVDEAEIKQNEFAKKLDILKAYATKKPGYGEFKKIFLKMQKKIVMDGKKLFMGLKMEYYHFLKRMV